MKKLFILYTLLLSAFSSMAQTTVYLRGDTAKITNVNKTSTLVIENASRTTVGPLWNTGQGKTIFKLLQISDIQHLQDSLNSRLKRSDSTKFIQNQNIIDQTANARIRGSITVNGSLFHGTIPHNYIDANGITSSSLAPDSSNLVSTTLRQNQILFKEGSTQTLMIQGNITGNHISSPSITTQFDDTVRSARVPVNGLDITNKDYVDAASDSSAHSLTFDEGLSKTIAGAQLGGSITTGRNLAFYPGSSLAFTDAFYGHSGFSYTMDGGANAIFDFHSGTVINQQHAQLLLGIDNSSVYGWSLLGTQNNYSTKTGFVHSGLGVIVWDSRSSLGQRYQADYSTVGKTYNRWIPDWGAVKGKIDSLNTVIGASYLPKANPTYTGTLNGPRQNVGDTSRAIRAIFIGSSITRGTGQNGVVEYDSTFVNKVSRLVSIKTVNRGYSGRAIQGGVNTPDSSFYAIRGNLPNYSNGGYIVLECQVNDAIDSTHYDIGVYKVQLDSVVLRLTGQRGWPANHIILANYTYYNPPTSSSYPNVEHRHDEYANLMQQEATLRGTLFYDDYYTFKTKYIATPTLLDAAVLHPTPAGYTVAAVDFTTWFSTYVAPLNPKALQIISVGAESVYGDLTVAQNASVNNDLAVGNKITASAISINGLPTLMDDTGTVFTPLGGQTTNSGSLGYSMAVMDGTNNRRAGPFISSTAFGMSQLYSTTSLPWGVWSAGTKWIGANSSGVTLPIISAYGSTATNFLTSVSGLVESRTPAQVLADILAAPIASPTFTGTVNTPALTVTANSGADVTPVLFTNANASGGTGLLINRTNTARTASVQFETSGTVAWATGMLRNGGSANTSFFIGQNADANATVPVLSLTTTARVGVNVIAPTAFLDLPAAITGSASLRIREAGLDPTTNNAGDIWVNGGLLKYYDGTNSTIRTIANIAQPQTFINKTLTTPIITDGLIAETIGNGSGANFSGYSGARAMFGYNNSTNNASITGGTGKGFEVWVNGTSGTPGAGTLAMTITTSGVITSATLTTPKTTGYTVATLPAGTVSMTAYVTDALSPVSLATVVGGGAQIVPVFYNGTNWIVQ